MSKVPNTPRDESRGLLVEAVRLCLYFLENNYADFDGDDDCEPDHCGSACKEGGCVRMRMNYCRAALKKVGEKPMPTEVLP